MNQIAPRRARRAVTLGLAAATLGLVAAPLAGTAAAEAAPRVSEEAPAVCTVTDGTLSWGVKESFRSYISGSIANGEWTASDGATYETPDFTWSGGTGEIDPATGTGSVSFPGTVHFSGHSGALDLTFSNPTIEFEGDGEAVLLLDSRSTDVAGELALDVQQEWIGSVEAPAEIAAAEGAVTLDAMPVTLTNAGVAAFADFYKAGDELDPISVSLTVSGCETTEVTATPEAPAEEETAVPAETVIQASVPWIPIAIGGAALFVIGLTLGMLIGGRKRPSASAAEAATTDDSAPQQPADGIDKLFGDDSK